MLPRVLISTGGVKTNNCGMGKEHYRCKFQQKREKKQVI